MTGLSLPRKSWYSYVSVHLFCFVSGLAWTKNYLLRQEEKHDKRKNRNIVMLLMLEIIGIRTLLKSLFNTLFRFGGNTGSSLQGRGQYGFYAGILSSRGGLLICVLEEKPWKVPVASATQSVQPCAKGTWETPNGTCSILNFWTRGIAMMDPPNFTISDEHRDPNPQKLQGDKCNSMHWFSSSFNNTKLK